MIFEEYKIDEETINDIYKTIKPLKLKDISNTTSTEKGYQTENIVKHFSEDLLKKILPIKNLWKDIWHIHYIKYSSGGYQAPHNHPNEKYSAIFYLNNSDGLTVFEAPINKKVMPIRGKSVIFEGPIFHYGEKSFNNKEVLVIAIGKI